METVIRVIETALPVFLALALGMLCRKTKMFSQQGVAALKSIVVNITLPAVLFLSFSTAEYSRETIAIPVLLYLVCGAALALGYLACKIFKQSKLTPYLLTGYEAGMLGYALFALLFPNEKTASFAIVDLGQVLFVFTLYKILLNGKGGLKAALNDAVKSPVLWAIIIGIIFGASGLFEALKPSGIAGILESASNFIGAPTSCVILLTIGYDLVPSEIRWSKTVTVVVMRFVIMGALLGVSLLINRFLLGSIIHVGALILMFILPPPYVLPVFADAEDERVNISSALSVITLISIALFAVMSALV